MKRTEMTLEFWNTVFQWGSVALVAATFVFVAGALWTGNLINERQATRLATLERELGRGQTAPRDAPARVDEASRPAARDTEPPRTLDAATRERLLDALRRVRADGPLEVRFVSGGTSEPAAFARMLADVIEEAGWTLAGDGGGSEVGTPPVGLVIRVFDGSAVPERAEALVRALTRAGLDARIERLATVQENVVELMVGLQQ
jgi:hypothetical protein